ncbi:MULTISPECIES: hypothetical protein [Mycolicibacter]|uniref:hypothetical protein n=1 Tax=Mycolicibacter TaxID=1073531 RepID=UPI001055871D|nr:MULTISPECIES: hypothetical protein [Mycolicibacter]
MTDREEIANDLLGRLTELDNLKAALEDKQQAVEAVRQEEERAREQYEAAIDAMLATGWATPAGLQAQGHGSTRRRGPGRRKAAVIDPAASQLETNNTSLAQAAR